MAKVHIIKNSIYPAYKPFVKECFMIRFRPLIAAITVFTSIFCLSNINAQAVLWNQIYTGLDASTAHSICQTPDNGFFVVGSICDSGGISKAIFLKTNYSGNLMGQKSVSQGNTVAYDCKPTFDRCFVVTGYVTDSLENESIGIAKYDSMGSQLFFTYLKGIGSNRAYSISQTPDSGFLVGGYTTMVQAADTDIIIAKIDKNGEVQFTKTFGGIGWDCCYALMAMGDGGCMVTGGTTSYGQNGGKDSFLAKLDVSGSVIWYKVYGGTGDDIAYNLTSANDGGYALVGSTTSFGPGQKAFLLKTDSNANYQWHKTIGGSSSDAAYGVVQLPDSGFMVAANLPSISTDSAAMAITTNANGDSKWSAKFNGFVTVGGSPLTKCPEQRIGFLYTRFQAGDTAIGLATISSNVSMPGVIKVSAGYNFSLFLRNDGSLFSCGYNYSGQLGDGTTTDRSTPILMMNDVIDMAAGGNHVLVLKKDQTLWSCGSNSSGQLGDGSTFDRHIPLQVMTNVKTMAAGNSHSLILKTDGTLLSCGFNGYGQLGDGTTSDKAIPKLVFSGVQDIAAGEHHSLILKTDGTLWSCGYNYYGQLGNGTTENILSPVEILSNVQSVSSGWDYSMILKKDNTLWACGMNNSYQLGDGSTTNRSTPMMVLSNVSNVVAGYWNTMAFLTNGDLWACGSNYSGQIGDGTTASRATFTMNMSGIQSVAVNYGQSLFLKSDGTCWAAGDNYYGELGDGTNIDHLSPVQLQVGNLQPSGPSITMQPQDQSDTEGQTARFCITATGTNLNYQWQKNGTNIPGATSACYVGSALSLTDDGSIFLCVVNNVVGSVTSSGATLRVFPSTPVAPHFILQPYSQIVTAGSMVSMTAIASGNPSPTYQWKKNGKNISGLNSPRLTIHDVDTSDAGSYTCVATNSLGSVESRPAVLIVNP